MTNVMRRACTEVDEALKIMPSEYVEKIPQKFRRLFYDARLDDFNFSIDPTKSINEQNVSYETKVILTILKLNYWCESEEEKNRLKEKLKSNGEKISEKYSFSAINSKVADETLVTENKSNLPIEVKQMSWFSKIWAKIKSIFKR